MDEGELGDEAPDVVGVVQRDTEKLHAIGTIPLLQRLEGRHLRLLGLRKNVIDLVAGRSILATQSLELEPCQFAVLQ